MRKTHITAPQVTSETRLIFKALRDLKKRAALSRHTLALEGQPFDAFLLKQSSLFLHSRRSYLKQKGSFIPALLSSPRSLGSAGLLLNEIQYSPIFRELLWCVEDPVRANLAHDLRGFTTSLFHEQNHRILWKLLPPSPRDASGIRRYLNFAESLVIMADMALGDQLGPEIAKKTYLIGATYDPGTSVRKIYKNPRDYKNYLHAAAYSTYLQLEGVDPDWIKRAIPLLFPFPEGAAERAENRAAGLDQAFIRLTNQIWQARNRKVVRRVMARGAHPLILPKDHRENYVAYSWTEKWLTQLGID